MQINNPIANLLSLKNYVVIDGALASQLQRRGCDINDALWSAKMLYEEPALIKQIHYDYFVAGADCAITASYQATPRGFIDKGISYDEAIKLIKLSASLAVEAKKDYLNDTQNKKILLVAGSIGPYGAYLANGAEYTGDYKLSEAEFIDFHSSRMQALIEAGVDLFACETLPSFDEIKALTKILSNYPTMTAWFSFTLKDSRHLSDGTELIEVVDYLNQNQQIVSLGINCISIDQVTAALTTLNKLTTKSLIVYPNSGDIYDPISKTWQPAATSHCSFNNQLAIWQQLGAKLIGGCCQTTPQDIKNISQLLRQQSS